MSKETEALQEIEDKDLLAIVDEVIAKSMPVESEEDKKKKEAAAQAAPASEAPAAQAEVAKSDDKPAEETAPAAAATEAPAAEVEKSSGNVSTPADGGQPEDGPGPGTSEDAVKAKKKSDKDLGAVDGSMPEASGGSTGSSEDSANPKSEGGFIQKSEVEKMFKSLEAVVTAVSKIADRVSELEVKTAEDMKKSLKAVEAAEEFRKSVTIEIADRLTKSFHKEVDELRKANSAVIREAEELRKSNDSFKSSNEALKAESEELRKSLKKPADTRAAIRNLDVVEKSVEQKGQKMFKSKTEVSAALDVLRKSGKVTAEECISYNVSNYLSDATKKLLQEA